jgi:hypothetical protein
MLLLHPNPCPQTNALPSPRYFYTSLHHYSPHFFPSSTIPVSDASFLAASAFALAYSMLLWSYLRSWSFFSHSVFSLGGLKSLLNHLLIPARLVVSNTHPTSQ